MTMLEQIRYRAKAILTALGVSVVGFLAWFVTNPDTAAAVQQLIPAPYAQFVPLMLAGIGATLLVNRVPNRTPTALTRSSGDDELVDEPSTDTTVVASLLAGQDGVEAGGGR